MLEIRWRSTVIRTKNDDLVIIPNGLFAKGVITVFNKDGLENRRWVYFNVHLRHPPNLVQKIVRRRARRHAQRLDDDARRLHHLALPRELARVRRALPARRLPARRSHRLRGAQAHLVRAAPREHRDALSRIQRVHRPRCRRRARRPRPIASAAGGSSCCRAVGILAPLDDGARQRRRRRAAPHGLRRRRGDHARRRAGRRRSTSCAAATRSRCGSASTGWRRRWRVLGEGDFFGEMSLMTGDAAPATVVAKSDAECYVINRALFQQILRNNAKLADEIGKPLERTRNEEQDRARRALGGGGAQAAPTTRLCWSASRASSGLTSMSGQATCAIGEGSDLRQGSRHLARARRRHLRRRHLLFLLGGVQGEVCRPAQGAAVATPPRETGERRRSRRAGAGGDAGGAAGAVRALARPARHRRDRHAGGADRSLAAQEAGGERQVPPDAASDELLEPARSGRGWAWIVILVLVVAAA